MSKTARLFAGLRVDDEDPENAFLRVTRYHQGPGGHVRFSVWVGDRARCVISIPEGEARDLVAFLAAETATPQPV
ncbi:MAG TPA: hypothetical protein VHN37_05325 [Actinomycetota bacterium]|nr:hypothetical protein [Actinomycetota bacterium]